jgi:hypothetical protein
MRSRGIAPVAVIALATLSACGGGAMGPSPTDFPAVASSAPSPAAPPQAARFVADLQRVGAVVGAAEVLEPGSSYPWIPVPAVRISIGGEQVSAFEYATSGELEDALRHTSADGHEFAGAQVSWISDPHIYRSDRLIVLYVGRSQPILDLLDAVVGPPIAGR